VIADQCRYRGCRAACERFKPDVIVLDDGFQHFSLHRDLDIVLIDCASPWGNGHMLPAGMLREPLRGLRRADLIVLTRVNTISDEEKRAIVKKIRQYAVSNVPIIESEHHPARVTRLDGTDEKDVAWVRQRKLTLVSALGNNCAFAKTVTALGGIIDKIFVFPDHHRYTTKEIDDIIMFSKKNNSLLMTTAKDAVKLRTLMHDNNMFVLEIALSLTANQSAFEAAVLAAVKRHA
jgi:tetraacyldisaccharide 4'-kinase